MAKELPAIHSVLPGGDGGRQLGQHQVEDIHAQPGGEQTREAGSTEPTSVCQPTRPATRSQTSLRSLSVIANRPDHQSRHPRSFRLSRRVRACRGCRRVERSCPVPACAAQSARGTRAIHPRSVPGTQLRAVWMRKGSRPRRPRSRWTTGTPPTTVGGHAARMANAASFPPQVSRRAAETVRNATATLHGY